MSILIAAILILTLLAGEASFAGVTDDVRLSVLLVSLLTLLMPSAAALQLWTARRNRGCESASEWPMRLRSMTSIHAGAWAVVSLAIVFVARWPLVVEKLTLSTKVPLFGELLLVFPALFGLVASWAIFIFGSPQAGLSARRSSQQIFAFWVRMRIVLVTVPILFAFVVADVVRTAGELKNGTVIFVLLWIFLGSAIAVCLLLYPRMLLRIWKTQPLTDAELRRRIDAHFRDAGLRPRKIHTWDTGNSVANAAAVGIVPGTEVIVLSDLLLERFSAEEVDAIVLHEIGHIRCRHCLKRIAMVLIPLLILAIDQQLPFGLHAYLSDSAVSSIAGPASLYLPALGFVIYLYIISRSVFRSMELEADRFAMQSNLHAASATSIDSALQKLALVSPQQFHRRSGLHPSISERLAFLMQEKARFFEQVGSPITKAKDSAHNAIDPVIAK